MVQDSFAVPKREVDYEVEDQYWGIKIFFCFIIFRSSGFAKYKDRIANYLGRIYNYLNVVSKEGDRIYIYIYIYVCVYMRAEI